jgi:hypothetical protein
MRIDVEPSVFWLPKHYVDAIPIRLQLVGQDLSHSGARPLPHLHTMDVGMHRSILVDGQIYGWGELIPGPVRSKCTDALRHHGHRDNESAREPEGLDEIPARDVGYGDVLLLSHDQPSCAARWMAFLIL